MSRWANDDRKRRVDEFLDGLLDSGPREAFERELTNDSALGAEVAVQGAIDAAMRRIYAAPAAQPAFAGTNGRAARPGAGALGRVRAASRSRRFLVAAVVALSVLGGWRISMWLDARPGPNPYAEGPKVSLADAYRHEVADGFRPDWVCENQEVSARLLAGRFGQGLVFHDSPEMSALGWVYVNTITPNSLGLLVDVQGDQVVVFIDRLDADASQNVRPESGLRLHRREVGSLVLYEVSHLSASVALDRFRAP